MTGHVAQGTGAEIKPATPVKGMIDTCLERPNRRRSQPQIPFQICRNRVFPRRASDALRPDGPVRPDMDLLDGPDETRLHDLDRAAQSRFRTPLVAHLGHNAVLLCKVTKVSRFIDGLR